MINIPFNKPYIPQGTFDEISRLLKSGNQLNGDGRISELCENKLTKIIHTKNKILLTNSCTSSLEIASLCCNLTSEDEVILPSYTFVATATAFTRTKAKIRFCDIDLIYGNICLSNLEELINKRTKVIVCVHYAGHSCDLDKLIRICKLHNIILIEDCAQGIHGSFNNKKLGTFGAFGCFSFHDTKNISSGEGGCLLINDSRYIERSQYIRDKGTNRKNFKDKLVNKYHWIDEGSSYILSELNACLLLHGLEESTQIYEKRKYIWEFYNTNLKSLEQKNKIKIQKIPEYNKNAAHIFYFLIQAKKRAELIKFLKENGVEATFHYVPLHNSPYAINNLNYDQQTNFINTIKFSESIIRLPLRANLSENECALICESIHKFFKN